MKLIYMYLTSLILFSCSVNAKLMDFSYECVEENNKKMYTGSIVSLSLMPYNTFDDVKVVGTVVTIPEDTTYITSRIFHITDEIMLKQAKDAYYNNENIEICYDDNPTVPVIKGLNLKSQGY